MKGIDYGKYILTSKGRWVVNKPSLFALGGGKMTYFILAIILFSVLMLVFGQILFVIGLILLVSVFLVPMRWDWRIAALIAGLIFLWLGLALL